MAAPIKQTPIQGRLKRKRRRRQDKPAVFARLVLDEHVKGDVGIVSEDLFHDLFPATVGKLLSRFLIIYIIELRLMYE